MKRLLLIGTILAAATLAKAQIEPQETKAAASVPSASARQASPPFQLVDCLSIGDESSEKSHGLEAQKSEAFTGGLDQPALRLLPSGDLPWESGALVFTMKVDPQQQNYLTVKLWGSDKGEECGRLVLFAKGLQVGYRDQGDYDVLNQTDEEAEAPGRFMYETVPLPPSLTNGKTSLSLKIIALGPMWPYGTTFDTYQKPFTQASRGIYRIYTHTDGYFVPPAEEQQGEITPPQVRHEPGEEVMEQSRQVVMNRLTKILASPAKNPPQNDAVLRAMDATLLLLGQAYKTSWTPACGNSLTIDQIVYDGDWVADFAADSKQPGLNNWAGAGPLGEAIVDTWPAISQRLDEKIQVGGAETTRSEAWAKTLRESVDYWRTHRRAYTNQSMIVDFNIFTANRALELMNPGLALPESQTLHYLYQATGIEPWLGSDAASNVTAKATTSNNDLPENGSAKPFGNNYYLITRKGLSRELGYVGTYGETILRFCHDMAVFTGDEKLRQQLRKIEDARLYFRYPGEDADGYRCMKLVSEIDNRTAHYPLSGAAYNAPNIREAWWMDVPALLSDDPEAVGAAQQSFADNQYFARVASRLNDPDTLGMMLNLDDYETVKALPPSSWRLPMGDDQPDFVFSDEQNAVLAIKHGETRLFINFYYRAENGVNRVARIFEVTPKLTRLAIVRPQVEVDESGQTYLRPDWIDGIRSAGLAPPGQDIHQAWAGEKLPIAKRPADATQPAYGQWGPFLGQASFYWLRYGDYLIGLNTTADRIYTLPVPSDYEGAPDLISGKEIEFADGVKVPPLSTVVLYLGEKH